MNKLLKSQLIEDAKRIYDIEITLEDIDILIKEANIVKYSSGDILCEIGAELTQTGFILDGIIKTSFITYDGKEITRFFHTKYSMFFDESLLGFTESKYRCEVVNDSTVLLFDTIKLKELINNNKTWNQFYIKALESGMRYKIYRENEFMTKNATERYKQFVTDFPELIDTVKQCDIATYLGIEPQSLSRIKKSLKNKQSNNT
ncbi:MAG: Crp/Fnr family transcriptional regulator [Clostridia bacterium]|nr:Crp/Fnr family transcriptional regulator [Clostridia bacterium]